MKLGWWLLAGAGVTGLLALLEGGEGEKAVPHHMTEWLPLIKAATAGSKIKASILAGLVENESSGDPDVTRYECCKKDEKGNCIKDKNGKHPKGTFFGGKQPCPGNTQRHETNRAGETVPLMSRGLVQMLISTGEDYGLHATEDPSTDERRTPEKSLAAAVRLLEDLLHHWGDLDTALAAYNTGSGNVALYRKANGGIGVPNQDYVDHIHARAQKYLSLDS